MFCPNCGTQLTDDASFCDNCGTSMAGAADPTMADEAASPATSGDAAAFAPPPDPFFSQPYAAPAPAPVYTAPITPAKPEKKGGALKLLLAGVAVAVVAALVVTALVFFNPFKKGHPMGALWGGVKQILMTEGLNAAMDVKWTESGVTEPYKLEGALQWGKDLRSSAGYMSWTELYRGDPDKYTFYYSNGEFAGWNDYDGDVYYETYVGSGDFDELADSFDDIGLGAAVDGIVKNGKPTLLDGKGNWDVSNIAKLAEDFRAAIENALEDEGMYVDLNKTRTQKCLTQAFKLVDGFFNDYCGQKDVQDKIFKGVTKTRKGGETTYEFKLNLLKLVDAAEDYLREAILDKKYKDLVELAEEILEEGDIDVTLKKAISLVAAELKDEINWMGLGATIPVKLTVDGKGRITALEATLKAEDATLKCSLKLSDYGKPTLNTKALDDEMAKAKKEIEERYSSFNNNSNDNYDDFDFSNWL